MAVFTFLPLLTQTGIRSSAHRLCNLIRPPKRPADSGNGHSSDVVLLGWKPSLFQIDSPRGTQAARGHRTNGFARVPKWLQRYFGADLRRPLLIAPAPGESPHGQEASPRIVSPLKIIRLPVFLSTDRGR